MKRKTKQHEDVDAFLSRMATTPVRGSCTLCKHPKRKAIEADCRRYAEARRTGETNLPFGTFASKHLRPTYDFPSSNDSIRRHMEKCCGTKILY